MKCFLRGNLTLSKVWSWCSFWKGWSQWSKGVKVTNEEIPLSQKTNPPLINRLKKQCAICFIVLFKLYHYLQNAQANMSVVLISFGSVRLINSHFHLVLFLKASFVKRSYLSLWLDGWGLPQTARYFWQAMFGITFWVQSRILLKR